MSYFSNYAIGEDYEPETPNNPSERCTWGRKRLERFLFRYTQIYNKKNYIDRTFILTQLEEVAKENHIELPSPEKMRKARTKEQARRFSSELVDTATENRISDYKYYFDGSNVVAYVPEKRASTEREIYDRTEWDELFDTEYPLIHGKYKQKNADPIEKEKIRNRIESELIKRFYEVYGYDDKAEKETCPEFIGRKITNRSTAYYMRKMRFHRKKDQVFWTAWWTITYDDEKFRNEKEFEKKLLDKFKNLCFRKKWRIMGVFERGEEKGRLHFHGFFYIPDGAEVGELVKRSHKSEKDGRYHSFVANTEFERDFGINEYEDIRAQEQTNINCMAEYTAKMLCYMQKGGRVYYSRHIPTEFIGQFAAHDMIAFFNITCKRQVKRYVVNPYLIKRTALDISRKEDVSAQAAYDEGLLDDPWINDFEAA